MLVTEPGIFVNLRIRLRILHQRFFYQFIRSLSLCCAAPPPLPPPPFPFLFLTFINLGYVGVTEMTPHFCLKHTTFLILFVDLP